MDAGFQFRLVIITNGNLFARVILERLVRERHDQIAGIVVITGVMAGKSRTQSLLQILRRTGWRHFVYKAQTYVVFALASLLLPHRAFFVPQLAAQLDVPVRYADQVAAPWVCEQVAEWKPDALLSVSCPQRISKSVLGIARKYSINIHSSLLPKYAGLSPYIWALAEGEQITGTTIHLMEEEFDTGKIVIQKEVSILEHDSAFALFHRLAWAGQDALIEAVDRLQTSEQDSLVPQDLTQRSYYSWPSRETIKKLRRRGHRLGRWRDFYKAIKSA